MQATLLRAQLLALGLRAYSATGCEPFLLMRVYPKILEHRPELSAFAEKMHGGMEKVHENVEIFETLFGQMPKRLNEFICFDDLTINFDECWKFIFGKLMEEAAPKEAFLDRHSLGSGPGLITRLDDEFLRIWDELRKKESFVPDTVEAFAHNFPFVDPFTPIQRAKFGRQSETHFYTWQDMTVLH